MNWLNRRALILWGTLLVVLVVANAIIYDQERLRAEGTIVYLELVPVDPRSLMQGDYMILNYRITQAIREANGPDQGKVVIWLDENNVGRYMRIYDGRRADDELLLKYDTRPTGIQIGAESFFFQEGRGSEYANARYAEIRVSESGDVSLVALCDVRLVKLGSP